MDKTRKTVLLEEIAKEKARLKTIQYFVDTLSEFLILAGFFGIIFVFYNKRYLDLVIYIFIFLGFGLLNFLFLRFCFSRNVNKLMVEATQVKTNDKKEESTDGN